MGVCSKFTMVVKTELCNYSGFKIYPGHGKKYVRMDQKMLTFITGKTEACQAMKRRNLTTKWTVQYRRINKKGTLEEEKNRSARPTQQPKDKQRESALRELKSRKGAAK